MSDFRVGAGQSVTIQSPRPSRPLLFGLLPPVLLLGTVVLMSGCSKPDATKVQESDVPVFKLVWSEYPSWSVFGVASELGIIDGKKGQQGALEKKWGVDIVLEY